MKAAIQKSTIPETQMFMIKKLDDKHFDPVWHSHCEYQLFVVLQGTGTRFIGDSIKSFKRGDLVLTGADLPHLWRSDEAYFKKGSQLSTQGIVIYLKENFLGEDMLQKEEMQLIKRLFKKSARGLEFYGECRNAVIRMMKGLTLMTGIEGLIQLLKILQVLGNSKEHHYISHTAYRGPVKENETDRMNKVYEYALANFRRKISMPELAEMLCMTSSSFSRYFTMRNNRTFSKFITELRIKHACKLLVETDTPVSIISYECGFNTLSNFNKQFKEIMHKRPSEYKSQFSGL